jgi:quercetin dioxygenase-like cupin family protein
MDLINLKKIENWQRSDVMDKKASFWPVDFETVDFQTATFCLEKNGEVHRHKHRKEENFWYIVSGSGTVLIGDEERSVQEGDALVIPEDTLHSAKTTDCRMRILQVCGKKG